LKRKSQSSKTATRPKGGNPAAPSTPGRRRLFALMALALAPLLAFGLLEGALRVAGYGYDTAFFKKARINNQDFFINNDSFVLRFFPPQLTRLPQALRMEAQKPPDTCRIFILGESAALGDPSPPYGAGRYLQALLSGQFPDKKFEVVNVSITAINSHVILPIARECASHQGDFWIIYMGNNEMVGPFGAASVFGAQAPPIWTVRLSLDLQKTRVGQWLMAAVRDLKLKSAKSGSWRGMEMFLDQQLPPDDPRKERVYGNFQKNLGDILQAGLGSGARVILNTVAVNLKDCSPFASIPPANQRLVAAAAQAQQQGRYEEAAGKFAEAAKLQPLAADLQYGWAQCLWSMTNFADAREHFQKACDCDALPFRADSRLNDLIRQAVRQSAGSNLFLFDAAAALAAGRPADVCGDETFLEHVHFNFDGNYRLARAWAGMIAPLLPESNHAKETGQDWLSQAACEQRLALTDWNRMLTVSEVMRRRRQAPLSGQSNNNQELESLSNEFKLLRRQMDGLAADRARALYINDIRRDPEDYLLLFNYGDFLEMTRDWKDAVAVWEQAQALLPGYYLGYLQEGRMLEQEGQLDEAESAFHRTLALYPRMTAAWIELSNIHVSEGKFEPALQECKQALSLEPGQPGFYVCLGTVLSRMNRPAEAMEQFHTAIQIRPDYWDAHLALARELSRAGQTAEATSEFKEVLRLDPNNQSARQALHPLQN
jgi:tetratricopeptide (TPR) repeat protein